MTKYTLYKYYPPKDYNFDALEQGYWFFKKFCFANDPFDCDWQLLDMFKNKWRLTSNDVRKDQTNDFAICSFSDDDLNKHLWALYADSYKGFVVEFEYGEEEYDIMSQRSLLHLYLYDVAYLNKAELEKIEEIPTLKLIPSVPEDMAYARKKAQEQENLFLFLYSIKEKDIWHLENEKRLLLGNIRPQTDNDRFIHCPDKNGYKVFFQKQMVKRIIIGYNVKEGDDNFKRLQKIAEQYSVPMDKVEKGTPFELKRINLL